MWMSDPGCEPIIMEKVETKRYCSACMREMMRHDNTFECPICRNHYEERMTH